MQIPCFPRKLFLAMMMVTIAMPVPAQKRSTALSDDSKPSGHIENFVPQGPLASANAMTLSMRFDADVVSAAKMTSATAKSVLNISPSIEGIASWASPRELRFTPRTSFRKASKYFVRLSPDHKKIFNHPIAGNIEFSFSTPPLQFLSVAQEGYTSDFRALVALKFSGAVDPADLYRHVKLTVSDKPLAFRVEKEEKSSSPRIITDPVTTDSVQMRLESGLPTPDGPLSLPATVVQRIPLKFSLVPLSINAVWEKATPTIQIQFSNGGYQDSVISHISIEPKIALQAQTDNNRINLTGDFKPGTRYVVSLRKGLMVGKSILLRDYTLPLWMPQMEPFISLDSAGGLLSTQGNMMLRVKSSGVTSLTLTAKRVHESNIVMTSLMGNGEYWMQRLAGEPRKLEVTAVSGEPPVLTEVPLRDLFGEKPSGLWFVSVTARRNEANAENQFDTFEETTFISASNIGVVAKRGVDNVVVWATALDSAKPLSDAVIRIVSASNAALTEGRTNGEGLAFFDGLAKEGANRPEYVIAENQGEISLLALTEDRLDLTPENNGTRDFLNQGYEAFLTSERGAYRPGENVHLFGQLRSRGVEAPNTTFPLELQLIRPDGRRNEPILLQTSAEGSLEKTVNIPAYAPTGFYQVEVQLPGTARDVR